MKIAVTANKPERDAMLDRRFGRCAYFIIIDTESDAWEGFPNPAQDASGGAGPQAAEFLVSKGAECVISGDYGPNAYGALQAAGITMCKAPEGSVDELIEAYLGDRLEKIGAPTGEQRHSEGTGQSTSADQGSAMGQGSTKDQGSAMGRGRGMGRGWWWRRRNRWR